MKLRCLIIPVLLVVFSSSLVYSNGDISGELKKWHKVTITFEGPQTSETATPNPFLDYRLNVTFSNKSSGKSYLVPGYYAADGKSADTSADSGNKWRVHLAPDATGVWQFSVSFRKGKEIAVNDDANAGESAGFMDGETGLFSIMATDKTGRDFRGKGMLQYVGKHHLKFAETGEYFLKSGADAPENLLAYKDFDGDFKTDGHKDQFIKTWEPHVKDWKPGDPSWQDGKGKGLIGAINYLASKGMNVFSFLTLNIIGDDQNVFPYTNYDERLRMDVSRLDQWEIVFEHGGKLGLYLHFKTSEAENQNLLDDGAMGTERKLYYRELIARFGHHLALNWNFGEENGKWGNHKGQTTQQRRDMTQYFFDHDPYHHLLVIHNGQSFDDLLGPVSKLTGASVQTNKPDFSQVHGAVRGWIQKSAKAGVPWVVACDEPGDAQHALITDKEDPNHDNARQNALWGTLLAGGAGIEWYFGYNHPESDLSCQDWRSRDMMWDQCRYALTFFQTYNIPFWNMSSQDNRSSSDDWVLASSSETDDFYAVVLTKDGGKVVLDLPDGTFDYGWFNPHTGVGLNGLLNSGQIKGVKKTVLQAPDQRDWILLIGPQDKLNPELQTSQLESFELFSYYDFKDSTAEGFSPSYKDKANECLAIDAAKYPGKYSAAQTSFPGKSDKYDVIITTMTETDGESSYRLVINGKKIGQFTNPSSGKDYQKIQHRWENVNIKTDDLVRVEFNSASNGKIPEGDAFAFSRGRWRSLAFVAPGAEYRTFVDLDAKPVEVAVARNTDYFKFDFDPKQAEAVFEEKDGLLVVEAEHFAQQSYTSIRKWYLTTADKTPQLEPDGDGNHSDGASGGAYIEILPDTRRNHQEKLIQGQNFTEDPGRIAVLYYPVYINNPGKYYVWGRISPSGSEDNGLHVGLDGKWPASGHRMQWISTKDQWQWDSKQRTASNHQGEPYKIYLDIKKPGLHTIMFSMREDGFELDKWLISKKRDILKLQDPSLGPDESPLKKMK